MKLMTYLGPVLISAAGFLVGLAVLKLLKQFGGGMVTEWFRVW